MKDLPQWQTADEGKRHTAAFEWCAAVENEQSGIYDRFVQLEAMYDPSEHGGSLPGNGIGPDGKAILTENVIASNVDTVTAAVTATEVRARMMTDDADWSEQRRARHLEWYAEGLTKSLGIHDECCHAFKTAALKTIGFVYVSPDIEQRHILIEAVQPDDIIADDAESRSGKVRQLHRKKPCSKVELLERYPNKADIIAKSQPGTHSNGRLLTDREDLIVLESWYLPFGKKDSDGKKPKGYRSGRHMISVDGGALVDEDWDEDFFPLAVFRWSRKLSGYFGVGGATRIVGQQRTLNKRNWQIDRQLDHGAVPITYVNLADAALAVKTTNRAGSIVPYKVAKPETHIAPAVSGETYQSRQDLKSSAFEEFGVSRMAAQSVKPAGLDSGVALREYRDQTTQRFAPQEKGFEQLVLDTVWLALWACKKLGKDAPTIVRAGQFGAKKIKWADVEMDEVKVQLAAASTFAKTPAGRLQTVTEWAQAGIISQDEARRLLRHPDLERAMSLYTAALEDIERTIDEIEDGKVLVPEPYQNLSMGIWRMQQAYLEDRGNGAPEEVLEGLRQWIVQAAHIQSQAANQNMAPVAGGMPQSEMAPNAVGLEAPSLVEPGAPPAPTSQLAAI